MRRALAAWCLCALALVVGLVTAARAAWNRERGDQLDKLERWCEAQSRSNDLLRVENARREWLLLGQKAPAADERRPKARRTEP